MRNGSEGGAALGSDRDQTYIRRVVDRELDVLLPQLPAIALEGAKGVGKTATALRRARTTFPLDDPRRRELLSADPTRLTAGPGPVLIDEWQRLPESWDLVRRAVDAGAPPGSFLLTGSASPAPGGMHSGAGRIVRLRMRPLAISERSLDQPTVSLSQVLGGQRPALNGHTNVGLRDYAEEICRSGYPGIRRLEARAARAQVDGYVFSIIDRDFPEMGRTVRNPAGLMRWLTAYAAATATTASYETIRDAATGGENEKPAKTTVIPYRTVLERLWILDPLPGWLPTRSHIARLGTAPKHHLADPALGARLLGADADALIAGDALGPAIALDTTLLAQLFESLVALSLRVYAQACEAEVRHLRTHGGDREVDLIVERGDHRVVAIEVKLGANPSDGSLRHLRWLQEQLGDTLLDALVITTGPDAYRRRDGIGVVPAALLGP